MLLVMGGAAEGSFSLHIEGLDDCTGSLGHDKHFKYVVMTLPQHMCHVLCEMPRVTAMGGSESGKLSFCILFCIVS